MGRGSRRRDGRCAGHRRFCARPCRGDIRCRAWSAGPRGSASVLARGESAKAVDHGLPGPGPAGRHQSGGEQRALVGAESLGEQVAREQLRARRGPRGLASGRARRPAHEAPQESPRSLQRRTYGANPAASSAAGHDPKRSVTARRGGQRGYSRSHFAFSPVQSVTRGGAPVSTVHARINCGWESP